MKILILSFNKKTLRPNEILKIIDRKCSKYYHLAVKFCLFACDDYIFSYKVEGKYEACVTSARIKLKNLKDSNHLEYQKLFNLLDTNPVMFWYLNIKPQEPKLTLEEKKQKILQRKEEIQEKRAKELVDLL